MALVRKRDRISVWFSCGVTSAVAAKLTVERYGKFASVRILNNPIAEEDKDNRRFLRDVEEWVGVEIEKVLNPKYPLASAAEVWEDRKYMSGAAGAPCSLLLKKRARQIWEEQNYCDHLVLGFSVEERRRSKIFARTERANLLPVLINEGLTKQMCADKLDSVGIPLPRIYRRGFPNANCVGCVKVSSPTYWNHVRKWYPKEFESRAKQSRRLDIKLVRVGGDRIYLDQLLSETEGYPLKTLKFSCGIFCEEDG